jgi:hypothetical protein
MEVRALKGLLQVVQVHGPEQPRPLLWHLQLVVQPVGQAQWVFDASGWELLS